MQGIPSKTGPEEQKHHQEASLGKEAQEGLSPQDNKVLLKDYLRLQFKERRMEAVLRKAGDKAPPLLSAQRSLKAGFTMPSVDGKITTFSETLFGTIR